VSPACQNEVVSDQINTFEVIATPNGWKITGDIDANTVPALSDAFDGEHAARDGGLVIDVEGVTFIDSSGLRVLLDLRSRVEPAGVTLRAAPRSVRRLLELTGLSDSFLLEDAVAD